jgi:copper chaperone NosL
VLGAVGLYDFWRWEHDYGHNLDTESAAIVVPGMTYQPPLIGTKQLLNFTASAWPGAGALLLGFAGVVVAGVLVTSRRRRVAARSSARLAAVAVLAGCAAVTPSIALGLDPCDHCRMTISDPRFAAAATSAPGRTMRFDSIECLLAWTLEQQEPARRAWVTDAERPGTLITVEEARFVEGPAGSSPMGRGWRAVLAGTADSATMTWTAVLAEARVNGALPAPGRPAVPAS